MENLRQLLITVACVLLTVTMTAQMVQDSGLKKLSSEQVTDAIIKMQQQHLIDSVIKSQLQLELEQTSGDRLKVKELEGKLQALVINDSLRNAKNLEAILKLRETAVGYPVAPFNDTLFFIYLRVGSYGPAQRGESIADRIRLLYKDPFFNTDSLQVVHGDFSYDIMYGALQVVMSVTANDALFLGREHSALTAELRDIIAKEVSDEIVSNSLRNWLMRIGLVGLIIASLTLIIFLINRFFKFVNVLLNRNQDKFLKGLTVAKVQLLTPGQFQRFVMRSTNMLRIVVIIITVYLSLPLLFSVFPETKNWTTTLIGWTMNPVKSVAHSILNYLPNLFTVLVIYFIFRYTLRAIRYFVDEIAKGNIKLPSFHADWAHPTFNILKFLMYALMLVLIFPYLPGSSSPAFQGVSVFIGILFSLGSSSAIANIMAGYVITYMRPFKLGDRVKIGEVTGDIIEKTLLVTKIRTIKNEDITLPNSTVLSSSTTNYSTNTGPDQPGVIIYTTVTIGYDVPWRNMHQALITAASRVPLILQSPSPFVFQTSLDDFYVSYQINAYIREANKLAEIYSELHCAIQDACNEAGIEIMSPHYRAMRDGNTTTIPSSYLGKDYQAPAFRVEQS